MNPKRTLTGALTVIALTAATHASALAAPPASTPAASSQVAPTSVRSAHASLQLDVGGAKAWVGQAVPITLRAYFRGAEGVTIEGAPQVTSSGIFTSDLAQEPHQATQMIGGEPVLVATWTGTVTPSSPGRLSVTAELPVRVRYREPAPQMAMPTLPDLSQDDPFGAFGGNPFDTSFFRHFVEQASGRVREESVSLRTSGRAIEALSLPTAGQPATFTGAVGRFDLRASVSSERVQVSEPVTLTVVVGGEGDFDRVDVSGVPTSNDWKAYPPSVTTETTAPGKQARRKVFQQVLVPLRGGKLTIPPVALVAFDPVSGRYVTRETSPLALSVDGTGAEDVAAASASASNTPAVPTTGRPAPDVAPVAAPAVVRPWMVASRLAPALLLVLAAAIFSRVRRRRPERALRREMKRAAVRGNVIPFYRAAHSLIEARLATQWKLPPDELNVDVIRRRLGPEGDPLAETLLADEAIRFGRARLENPDLMGLCSSIERALGGVS